MEEINEDLFWDCCVGVSPLPKGGSGVPGAEGVGLRRAAMLKLRPAGWPCPFMGDETRGRDRAKALPLLLQHGEVFFEGRADLVEQLHQGMAEEAGAGRLRVEMICRRPVGRGWSLHRATQRGARSPIWAHKGTH